MGKKWEGIRFNVILSQRTWFTRGSSTASVLLTILSHKESGNGVRQSSGNLRRWRLLLMRVCLMANLGLGHWLSLAFGITNLQVSIGPNWPPVPESYVRIDKIKQSSLIAFESPGGSSVRSVPPLLQLWMCLRSRCWSMTDLTAFRLTSGFNAKIRLCLLATADPDLTWLSTSPNAASMCV